jgi:hypothetical protein
MYPKSLPATYEFRRPQLIKLSAPSPQLSAAFRYGQGTVVLYNFSDKPVTGRLILPECSTTEHAEHAESKTFANSASSMLKLLPNERREVPVTVSKFPGIVMRESEFPSPSFQKLPQSLPPDT